MFLGKSGYYCVFLKIGWPVGVQRSVRVCLTCHRREVRSQKGVKIIDVKCLMFSLWSTRKLWWFKESENILFDLSSSEILSHIARMCVQYLQFLGKPRVWKNSIKMMASFHCIYLCIIFSIPCLLKTLFVILCNPTLWRQTSVDINYLSMNSLKFSFLISGLYLLIVQTNTDSSWWLGREITTAGLCRKVGTLSLKFEVIFK